MQDAFQVAPAGLDGLQCPSCGIQNRPGARSCSSCGTDLPPGAVQAVGGGYAAGLPGQLHQARYEIVRLLGKGGFGAVYLARDRRFGNRPVAVKEMNQRGLSQQEVQAATLAFEREARLLAGLTHPNLPRVYDAFAQDGRSYLVMDYLEGETLGEYLASLGGPLPQEEVLQIGAQLSDVLDYLHTRQPPIIFRDLKPANILRTQQGHLFLIDFGIARHFKPGQAKDTVALGSPGYAAPEQYGKQQTDARADVYSLGATLHHLLTGADPSLAPFQFGSLPGADAPTQALGALLQQMLEVKVERRTASMALVKEGLLAISREPAPPVVPAPATAAPTGVMGGPDTATISRYGEHVGPVRALAWSPNGTAIASVGHDAFLRVWDAASAQTAYAVACPSLSLSAVAWSPRDACIFVGGAGRVIYVYDARTGSPDPLRPKYAGHRDDTSALAFSRLGSWFASASLDGWVGFWRLGGSAPTTICSHRKAVHALAWAPDGTRLASAGEEGVVQVWRFAPLSSRAERFHSRGIGSEFGLDCFVCGAQPQAHQPVPNIAAFVLDEEAGKRVVGMFHQQGSTARLDYRPYEPDYVQVKVGACAQHVANLECLHRLVGDQSITSGKIGDAMLARQHP